MKEQAKSPRHVAFVGEFEFYTSPTGDLYWARIADPLDETGSRRGQFYTNARGAEFALRIARITAGEMTNS